MEHSEWVPDGYRGGIGGQRIAIVGHSHHDNGSDHAAYTDDCLRNVISGDWQIAFFTSIARCFGYEDRAVFWSRVLFFNFLPTKVGPSDDRYGYGSAEQLEAGRARVLRILDQHQPAKLFVFSTKAWREFPPTFEENGQLGDRPLLVRNTYITPGGHRVRAMGLRHPQGANREAMAQQVSQFMAE